MMEAQPWILPFCANFFRCVAGLIGFSLLMMVSRHVDDFKQRRHDRRGMLAVALTTIFGPFAGVAFSLLAVQYTARSEEHTSELQSRQYLVCRLLLEKKKNKKNTITDDHS